MISFAANKYQGRLFRPKGNHSNTNLFWQSLNRFYICAAIPGYAGRRLIAVSFLLFCAVINKMGVEI